MYLYSKILENQYTRTSKLGVEHSYIRKKTIAIFRCDNCNSEFERSLKSIDSKRLNNNYFHCCSNCDAKRFAQRKGVEHKKVWDWSTDLDITVDKF